LVGFDDLIERAFRDTLHALQKISLVGVGLEISMGFDEHGPSLEDEGAEKGGVDEVAEANARVERVMLREYFGVGALDLAKDMADDESRLGSTDAALLQEDPGVVAFRFAALNVRRDPIVLCGGNELDRRAWVVVVEVHGDRGGAVLDEQVNAVGLLALRCL
jgi:hypothetical protein